MTQDPDPVQAVFRRYGNGVHAALVYDTPVGEQRELLSIVRSGGLVALAHPQVHELLSGLREAGRGSEALETFERAIVFLLERELREARPLKGYEHAVLGSAFHGLGFDAIEGSISGPVYRIEAKRGDRSPEDDGSFALWRDTEAHVTVHVDRDLLVWRYLNVAPAFRGQGLGSELVRSLEAAALSFGVSRFSVEWANMAFWSRFGYQDYPAFRIGSGALDYHPEAYRSDRSA